MRIAAVGLTVLALVSGSSEVYASSVMSVLVSNEQVVVTRADFDAEMERIPPADRFEFLASRERIGRLLQEILTRKTMASEARSMGLEKSQRVTRLHAVALDRILAEERIAQLERDTPPPDFEPRAREIYKLNPERFTVPTTLHGAHILIDKKSRSAEAAMKLAREVRAMIAGGRDFGELVAQYSDDVASKLRKGDLGYFAAANMAKPFADKAFSMKKGEISDPVETEFGVHIIQVHDIRPGSRQSYDEVKDSIISELKANWLTDLKQSYVFKTRDDKRMKVNEDGIMKIKTNLSTAQPAK